MYACAEQAEHIARAISISLTFERANFWATVTLSIDTVSMLWACVFFCYDSFVKMESGKRKYLGLWKRRTLCSTPHGASILRRKEFRAVTSPRLHTAKQFQEGAESEFICIPLVLFSLRRKNNFHMKRVKMPFSVQSRVAVQYDIAFVLLLSTGMIKRSVPTSRYSLALDFQYDLVHIKPGAQKG